MPKKHKQPTDERQLSLFDVPEGKNTPAYTQPVARQKEMSAEGIREIKERFLALGSRFGYPTIAYNDHLAAFTGGGERREVGQGEAAWKECLLHERLSWIAAFTKWLSKGELGSAHTWHSIRANREDMLLHYAMLKHYPEQQIGDLLVGAGEQAWKSAARALDRSALENAIHQLAEGDLLDE